MCFTINIYTNRDAIEKRFNADTSSLADFEFRYFFRAFDQPEIPVVTQNDPGRVQLMSWGLIPHWVKDQVQADKVRSGTYNARAESLHQKPSFRNSYTKKRCWVIVTGFFEWQQGQTGKIPWYIKIKNNQLFALAGVYDQWVDPRNGSLYNTFSIVTTRANPLMEKIHNTKKRMPVILDQKNEQKWLLPGKTVLPDKNLFEPFDQDRLETYTVGKYISDKNADPRSSKAVQKVDYYSNKSLF
ncbi:MAG: SOS response-associated peptidase [Bacteroidales bacterium]|nr:SOS response-associated peptidase [Bacteroidales bacterium]